MIAPMTDPVPSRAEIVVDLAAIRHNVRILRDLVQVDGPVQLMVVVKADGYGHGMVEAAEAARDAGADWLGVATIDEALALRAAGDRGPAPVLAQRARRRLRGRRRGRRRGHGVLGRGARGDRRGRRARGAAQGRHRPVARRRGARRLGTSLFAAARRPRGAPAGSASPASGRTSWPATSPRTRRTTPRRRPSARRSRWPRRPASTPRSPTSPTRPPRSCARRRTSTWSAAASRRTASTRRPARPRGSACARR